VSASAAIAAIAASALLVGVTPAAAQNLVQNGDFDDDAAHWQLTAGTQILWTDILDANDCPGSGSALVPSSLVGGVHKAGITQCIPIAGGGPTTFVFHHRGYGMLTAKLEAFLAPTCVGANGGVSTTFAQDPDAWNEYWMMAGFSPVTDAVRITLEAADSEPHGLSIDGVVVSGRFPLLLDGFEGDEEEDLPPCRWN
jgi:hypothetical protein